jgi:hypothetical protein
VSVTVTTQAELDAALAVSEAVIYIESDAGLWLTIRATDSSRVVAWGSSHVEARGSSHVEARDSSHVEAWGSSHVVAWGSSHVEAWDSSHVEAWGSSRVVARDSSHVEAWGSSHVEARDSSRVVAWGSSHVVAWGSSHVEAWDSSHVVARGSSHVVARGSSHVVAGKYVAVHLHSQRVELEGGVVIDMTAVDRSDPFTWCELHGVAVGDGVASLYKALDENLTAGHAYRPTVYAPGTTVECPDWRDDGACGGGLHFGPTTAASTAYRVDAKRWVRVEVPVSELRPINDGGTPKCKAPRARVVEEVDRWGTPIAAPTKARKRQAKRAKS